jgi:hypothetical protein
MLAVIVANITIRTTTRNGADMTVDVPGQHIETVLRTIYELGAPAANGASPRSETSGEKAIGWKTAIDMAHARLAVDRLGAKRQTECLAILALEAERGGLEALPREGFKDLLVELMGHEIASPERSILANAVQAGMVAWTKDKAGVQLAPAGRRFVTPAAGDATGGGKGGARNRQS